MAAFRITFVKNETWVRYAFTMAQVIGFHYDKVEGETVYGEVPDNIKRTFYWTLYYANEEGRVSDFQIEGTEDLCKQNG
jgi:hypothetical protein